MPHLPITAENLRDWFDAPDVDNPLAGDHWWQLQSSALYGALQILRLAPPGPAQQQALVELRRAFDTVLMTLPAPADAPKSLRALAPFAPAPFDVVEAMLDLAELQADDVLYDLGSGDGRIVLSASRRGVHGIGIEIDALLVGQASERVAECPDYRKAVFLHDDMHNADLSQATVVTCYLLSSSMTALRDKFRACRPGTRIISHAFDIPGWEPDRIVATAAGPIFRWVV